MPAASKNSFGARDTLAVGNQRYEVHRLEALKRRGMGHVGQLPFSIRILLAVSYTHLTLPTICSV